MWFIILMIPNVLDKTLISKLWILKNCIFYDFWSCNIFNPHYFLVPPSCSVLPAEWHHVAYRRMVFCSSLSCSSPHQPGLMQEIAHHEHPPYITSRITPQFSHTFLHFQFVIFELGIYFEMYLGLMDSWDLISWDLPPASSALTDSLLISPDFPWQMYHLDYL